jgi:hypothetical protein
MHFLFFSGFYKFLPSLHFGKELCSGYSLDLLMIPGFIIQILNNVNSFELDFVQSYVVLAKFSMLFALIFEIMV